MNIDEYREGTAGYNIYETITNMVNQYTLYYDSINTVITINWCNSKEIEIEIIDNDITTNDEINVALLSDPCMVDITTIDRLSCNVNMRDPATGNCRPIEIVLGRDLTGPDDEYFQEIIRIDKEVRDRLQFESYCALLLSDTTEYDNDVELYNLYNTNLG